MFEKMLTFLVYPACKFVKILKIQFLMNTKIILASNNNLHEIKKNKEVDKIKTNYFVERINKRWSKHQFFQTELHSV